MERSIRNIRPEEYREAENLTREAFWNVYKPGCDEHFVLHQFRGRPEFVRELEYVMEEAGNLVAHIMYCRAQLCTAGGAEEVMMFGPVSVDPTCQGQGYGSQLIRYTLEKAAEMGCGAVVITGNPEFYHRFGFESATRRGIYMEGISKGEEASYFMVKELRSGFLPKEESLLELPGGYMADPQEVERFDRQFPPKVKEKRPGQLV